MMTTIRTTAIMKHCGKEKREKNIKKDCQQEMDTTPEES
jgi:hypothetical protein